MEPTVTLTLTLREAAVVHTACSLESASCQAMASRMVGLPIMATFMQAEANQYASVQAKLEDAVPEFRNLDSVTQMRRPTDATEATGNE